MTRVRPDPVGAVTALTVRRRGAPRTTAGPMAFLAISLAVLFVVAVVSLFAGSKDTSFGQVLAVLIGDGDEYIRSVVDARIPRTILGAVIGAALAMAGVVIQGITRNPLGEPGLLGVSAGASAAVVTATAFLGFTGGAATVWVALPGAVIAVVVVYVLGRRSRSESVVPLILSGAVVSAVLGAYVQAMILMRPAVFESYRHWVVGSLAGARLETLAAISPALIAGAVLALVLASGMNALALGDDVAMSLGIRVGWVRGAGIAAATLLAAAATAAAGPIAFVGLAVPHVARALVGADHRWQLPVSVILGAALLIGSDIVGRTIVRPTELMVGVVTAFVGAPFLLIAVRRGRVAN